MRLRRIIFGIVAALLLVALGGFAWNWRPSIEPIAAGETPTKDGKIIRHGAELAAIGNCNVCHTAASGKLYAGGLPLPTPFGTIFSTNITPDIETGIGTWSEAAFLRSMRDGVDREGRQLYPAFPYDHFTNTTDDDIRAIYAFLMSQPAVRNAVPQNKLTFPLNFRPLVAGWNFLFLRRGPLQPDTSKDAEWNRGRYLVEGLGHCGSCHTPRNILGAEKRDRALAGGSVEGWDAPALNSSSPTARKWTVDQLAEYLSTGWNRSHGAAAGPMADVTNNLGHVSSADVRAIAVYIASLSPKLESPKAPERGNPTPNTPAEVMAIYIGACANCHNEGDDVGPSNALPLSLSSALQQASPVNAIRTVLQGVQPQPGRAGAYMPAFDGMLTDKQIASLVEYARARYTASPPWNDVQNEVAKARRGGS